MRTLRKNQQNLKYALQYKEIPEFETIYYTDGEGNKYPTGIKPTGKTEILYGFPGDFLASITGTGGEAEAVAYGLSISDYAAKIVFPKGAVPLKEGALVWHESEPQYKHIEMEVDGEEINGDFPIRTSADYYVVKIPPALDTQLVFLQAINK